MMGHKIQCNLPTTATNGTAKKWLLYGGDRYGEVKYIVNCTLGILNAGCYREVAVVER